TFRIAVADGYSAAGVLVHGNIEVQAGEPPPETRPLRVGAAKRTLDPTVEVAPPDGQVFLGGYGLGAVRRSTGVLGSGACAREFADLWVGSVGGVVSADATSVLTSQFDDSSCTPAPTPEDPGHTTLPCSEPGDFPDWDLVDDSVRVLRATRPDGSTIATLVNFAAHSTVMGSGNRLISADWPGPTGEKVEVALGVTAVV